MEYDLSKRITGYPYDDYGMYSDLEFNTLRLIGYTIVGVIENNKLLIKYSICNYEEGDKFVKKLGVSKALDNTTYMEVDLTNVPQNETIRVFHGYCDLHVIPDIERRYLKKKQKYWLSRV